MNQQIENFEPPYGVGIADDECASCGKKLGEQIEYSWSDHGFCHAGCATNYRGGFHLLGTSAREMAERDCKRGGPGFESDLIADWLKGATDNAPAAIARLDGAADLGPSFADSWSWRLWSGGKCQFFRLTPKSQVGLAAIEKAVK